MFHKPTFGSTHLLQPPSQYLTCWDRSSITGDGTILWTGGGDDKRNLYQKPVNLPPTSTSIQPTLPPTNNTFEPSRTPMTSSTVHVVYPPAPTHMTYSGPKVLMELRKYIHNTWLLFIFFRYVTPYPVLFTDQWEPTFPVTDRFSGSTWGRQNFPEKTEKCRQTEELQVSVR